MLRGLLVGALSIGACTNEPATLGTVQSSAEHGERCEAAVQAAQARWAVEAGDSLAEVDAVVRHATTVRKTPVPPEDLGEEIARLHARVDVDLERVHATRRQWEAAKRTLEADAIALDHAIDAFEQRD